MATRLVVALSMRLGLAQPTSVYLSTPMQDAGYGLGRIFLPRTPVNRGLLGWLLAFRGRLGAQPQRDVSGLHRFLGHAHQVVAQST